MAVNKRKLYLGPQIRRIRKNRGITQAMMAKDLEISPSYVNLIERNQRPISAELLVRLAQAYDLDVASLADDRADDLFANLAGAFADPIFQSAGVTREDAHELAAGNPVLADAVAALYRAYQQVQNEAIEARAGGSPNTKDPVEEARSFIQTNRNHFPPLEAIGEAIAKDVEKSGLSSLDALVARFEKAHRLKVRILPTDVMAGAYRRLNRHSGEVLISEGLDQASRTFHLALQLCLLEHGSTLDKIVNEARFDSDEGRRLSRATVANYAAATVMLPYGKFLSSAKSLRYDVEALGRRFGASFEQIAHRLTTLNRPGEEGIAFFFLRVDAAGNISKRYSADVFPFARYGGSCPLWNLHETFRTPRRIFTQLIQLPDQSRYFSISRTVHGGAGGYGAPSAERAVALGCALENAADLIYADGIDLETTPTMPIGVTCRLCDRQDCAARAHPPLRRRLIVDEYRRLATPFSFAFD